MTETTEKCRAIRRGVVDLLCGEPLDHVLPKDGKPGTWHEAAFTDRRELDYDGAHHSIVITETVRWEPADHVTEAITRIMAGGGRRAITEAKTDDPEAREDAEFAADAASLDDDFRNDPS